ncbi:cyclophilin-like fold protein [Nonomuraea bangladeshensis]|uniref:cyclophilin-like fold protein n=1 Tax=Nonomuraea bangladeshensis TaxID=404385 RepID=UPI003C30D764
MSEVVIAAAAAGIRRLAACLLAGLLAGCSAPAGPLGAGTRTPPVSSPGVAGAGSGVPVVLRFGDHVVAARLTDTMVSRQLTAMLPLTVQLADAWGQAKAGPLPRPLTAGGDGTPVHDPAAGGIYFWPVSGMIAVYYDDLGQTVPDPGLVRLGVVEAGLDDLSRAGRRLTVRIEPVGSGSR